MPRPVKTRFAPSPTGSLHIGGVRTALFAWLFARHHGGTFIVRIEDTDRLRSTEESERAILDSLAWLGLSHDNNELYYQMNRLDTYRQAAQQLIDSGHAYYCYCSADELSAMRKAQIASGLKPRYDRRCRERAGRPPAGRENVQPTVRFKQSDTGVTEFDDRVHGHIRVANTELDDLVLLRSDGLPTYNLSVVVDDADMGISHVIRGDDHLSNTPRQINIWRALFGNEAILPEYAHVPMILDAGGTRLSKRAASAGLQKYRDDGYLPEALINYLVRLGWSHGDREIFTREELIALFDLQNIQTAAASFDPKKLEWLNKHYMMQLPADSLHAPFEAQCRRAGINIHASDAPDLNTVIEALRSRYANLKDMAEGARFFYEQPEYPIETLRKRAPGDLMKNIRAEVDKITDWEPDVIRAVLQQLAERHGGFGVIGKPLRYVLCGNAPSPDLPTTMHCLGRDVCMARIASAIDRPDGEA